MPFLRKDLMFAVLVATAVSLAACENTIRGAGKDVDETAHAVGDVVRK